ncbi:MAG: NAD(P)/FAD-dependent oxidoreductase [Dehalococcoidia bacterium]|nr:MAG: NAD(P)/FAD-dependent oxidoreductase [Dehalococcoidia bacterium]
MNLTKNYPPIMASDEELRAALEAAHVPSLMNALVHVSGDISHIRGDIRPVAALFQDPQGGISREDQARGRAIAFEVLKAYRDGGSQIPPRPSDDAIEEMTDYIIGEGVPRDYKQFLHAELRIDGQDPYAHPSFDGIPEQVRQDFHVVIIGAGMSGLLAAIRLDQEHIPYTIIEKNSEAGGTWWQNQYPGCRVDNQNHIYSYSFEPYDWPYWYSNRQVLFEYFNHCADKYGIRPKIRFNTAVDSARFDESTGRWTVTVRPKGGAPEEIVASAVISAVGQLNRPRLPAIIGRESFEGVAFHSGEWRHDVDLTGKRVGVVGTGASAFQFVPEIAQQASEVVIFQRTPPWMGPQPIYRQPIPEGKHWLLKHVPFYYEWYRFALFWRSSEGMLKSVTVDPEWTEPGSVSRANQLMRQTMTAYITRELQDAPDILAHAIPDYPPGGKRMVVDDGNWLRALKRDNVRVVVDPIAAITPTGITTQGGQAEAFDVIVYATGFQASNFLMPMDVYGRDGVELHDRWAGTARAYKGITIPGYPNLFMLYGPNTNIVVNGSTIFFAECEMRYVMGCIHMLLSQGKAAMDVRREVHDAYNEWIDQGNALKAWGTFGVTSWYKNTDGHVTQNWPFTLLEFWTQTREPDPGDYEFIEARVPVG